ncbi:MAG TPA: D-2-hydroxyacid dehydrogenase [Terriglobales bacterium]|jgi:phosphoglycerate dehydrogenase-like enzyme|nr:D-2-hydroxyacid dehydrogenase [Terriglobales bacterium]
MKLVISVQHRFSLWTPPAWVSERLRRDFPQLEVVHLPGYEGLDRELPDTEILLGWSLKPEQIQAAKRLRWIHSPAAAVHQLMIPELVASDIQVTNAASVHGPVVAEHAIALVLALAKRLDAAARYQQQKVWAQTKMWEDRPRPREVAGSTLGLIGMGAIGREVARLALALGMRVLIIREHPEKSPGVQVFGPSDTDRVLAESDFVVLCAPLTPRTRHLIHAERLARMKPDACMINVSRGALIDDAALLAALRARRLGAAALDVFAEEPLPPGSPYWEMENVLVTPHTAAVTEKLWERHYALLSENLRRYLAGQPLLGLVDKHKGY